MRSIKLVPALAGIAALLAVAPTGASGRASGQRHLRHAAAIGGCQVALEAPSVVTFGEPVVGWCQRSISTAAHGAQFGGCWLRVGSERSCDIDADRIF